MNKFRQFSYIVSKNHTRTVWVLKCDIRKFFASIDQSILKNILHERIVDEDVHWLLEEIIASFISVGKGKGLPLGNLTSQLLVNVYMNEFDQFAKPYIKGTILHTLRG
jgi:retron-type reverse transcriptase